MQRSLRERASFSFLVRIALFVASCAFCSIYCTEIEPVDMTDGQLVAANLTYHSVMIMWPSLAGLLILDSSQYTMYVSWERENHRTYSSEPRYNDPECSIQVMFCRLTDLVADSAYRVTVHIYTKSQEHVASASVLFSTPEKPIEENMGETISWYLLYIGVPIAFVIFALVGSLLMAKKCGLCCWSRAASRDRDVGEQSRRSHRSQSDAKRKQTQEWVEDIRSIQPEPNSTYDQPTESAISPLESEGYIPFKPPQGMSIPLNPVGNSRSDAALDSHDRPTSPTGIMGNYSNVPSLPRQPPPPGPLIQQLQQKQQQKQQQHIAVQETAYANTDEVMNTSRRMFPQL